MTQLTLADFGITFFVLAVIGIGLQLVAQQLAKQKNRQKFPDEEDDSPSTITTRGAWLQTLWGQHRIAPVVGFVGNRRERHTSRKTPPDIVEDAWHLLNVGKCNALTKIWKDGNPLFEGLITPETHPSGEPLTISFGGATWKFRIYWGEDNQPIDPFLRNAITIASRWPGICYIVVLNQKIGTKGGQVAWPTFEYELASRPLDTDLATDRWFFNAAEVGALDPQPIHAVTNGAPDIGFIEVPRNLTSDFFKGMVADVTGQPLSTVTVIRSIFIEDEIDGNVSKDLTTWTRVTTPQGDQPNILATIAVPQLDSPPGITDIQYLIGADRPMEDDISGYSIDNVDLFFNVGFKAKFEIFVNRNDRAGKSPQVSISILDVNNNELVRGLFGFTTSHSNPPSSFVHIDTSSPAGKTKIDAGATNVSDIWSKIFVSVIVEAAEIGLVHRVRIRCQGSPPHIGLGRTHQFAPGHTRFLTVVAPVISQADRTHIFVEETLTGWSQDTGTITPTAVTAPFNGANAAAMLDEILFLESPRGAGLDKTLFDRVGLATIGDTLATTVERAPSHAIARGGTDAKEIVADIMNDYGIVIAWDYSIGKFIFRLNREAPVSSTHIPESLLEGIPPLLITSLLSKFVPKAVYTFKDRTRNFTTSTVSIDDDGQVLAIANQRSQKIGLKTITDVTSAGLIANRKDMENPSNAAGVELTASRAARYLLPGDTLSVEGLPDILRITSITPDSKSAQVEIAGLFSVYGKDAIPLAITGGAPGSATELAADDLQTDIIELDYPIVPRETEPALSILRIRANPNIIGANILIAKEDKDVSFSSIVIIQTESMGGTLDQDISDTAGLDPEGEPIKFTIVGDIRDYINLPFFFEDQNELFRSGKFVARIGDEWLYIRGIEIIDDALTKIQLGQALRGRFNTRAVAHSSGDKIYITDIRDIIDTPHGLEIINDPSFEKAIKTFFKVQSIAVDSLETPPTESFTPEGLSFIPRRMPTFTGDQGSLEYDPTPSTGGITIMWSAFSDNLDTPPNKGVGEIPFGREVTPFDTIKGSPHKAFCELRTHPGEVLKDTIDLSFVGENMVNGILISDTEILNAFGELPDTIQIWGYYKDISGTLIQDEPVKSPYNKIIVSKMT